MKKYFVLSMIFVVFLSMQLPFRNEPTSKAELGELLFSDPILSSTGLISCASCHIPAFAFADTAVVSKGVHGRKGTRNTPGAMNLSLQKIFFWDGRSPTLEAQALEPISNPSEMNLPIAEAVRRLRTHQLYSKYFQAIFKRAPDSASLAEAIAAFERSLETTESPFDNWKFSGDAGAVSEEVKRGFALFNGKGKCVSCHFGSDFTQSEFKNVGLFDGKLFNDSGRYTVTKKAADIGKFKTPGLRNVALTAPYMHNGKFKTLREVIEFYNDPTKIVPGSLQRDTALAKPLGLTTAEMSDIESFLHALTDKRFNRENEQRSDGYRIIINL